MRLERTYTASTPAAVVEIGRTRRLKREETNVLIKCVFDSLNESARSFKPWEEAWATATADGIERYANYFMPTARETYMLAVPECLLQQRLMRDLRDVANGRKKPRGEPRRICKCADCRKQRQLDAPRA
jgi:hypothetical protein